MFLFLLLLGFFLFISFIHISCNKRDQPKTTILVLLRVLILIQIPLNTTLVPNRRSTLYISVAPRERIQFLSFLFLFFAQRAYITFIVLLLPLQEHIFSHCFCFVAQGAHISLLFLPRWLRLPLIIIFFLSHISFSPFLTHNLISHKHQTTIVFSLHIYQAA